MVAYAPTKEGSEGQKAKYMAALNSTAPSMPARSYVFVLTDAIARTGKRGEGGGVRGAGKQTAKCWAHMARRAQHKRQATSGLRRIQQARSSEHGFCTPKIGVSYTFQSANRSNRQTRLHYILTM